MSAFPALDLNLLLTARPKIETSGFVNLEIAISNTQALPVELSSPALKCVNVEIIRWMRLLGEITLTWWLSDFDTKILLRVWVCFWLVGGVFFLQVDEMGVWISETRKKM
ncbi:hypothetical protein Peur_003740 [Populus x canadensis]